MLQHTVLLLAYLDVLSMGYTFPIVEHSACSCYFAACVGAYYIPGVKHLNQWLYVSWHSY